MSNHHLLKLLLQLLPLSFIWNPRRFGYHCLHRILSALSDSLCGIYYEYKSVKELWITLEKEYGLDDTGIKRFTSSSFNKFMMSDNKPVNDQLHEFQDFIRHLQSKGNQFSYDYKVSCLIDTLSFMVSLRWRPPSPVRWPYPLFKPLKRFA